MSWQSHNVSHLKLYLCFVRMQQLQLLVSSLFDVNIKKYRNATKNYIEINTCGVSLLVRYWYWILHFFTFVNGFWHLLLQHLSKLLFTTLTVRYH